MKKLILSMFTILGANIVFAQIFNQDFSCSEDVSDYIISESSGDNECNINNRFDYVSDFFKIENEAIVWEKQTNISKVPTATQVISRTTNILEGAEFLTIQFKLKVGYTHTGAGADVGQIYFYFGEGSNTAWQPTTIASRPPVAETSVFYNFLLNISTNSAKFRLGGDTQLFEGEQLITILLNRTDNPKTYYLGGSSQTISSKSSHIWIGNTQITAGTKALSEIIPKKFKVYIDQNVRDSRVEIDDIKIWDNNVLPIRLGSFSGKLEKSQVVLNWNTLFENDNAFFEILKSKDGISFSKTGEIKSKGNSNEIQYYSYIDKNIAHSQYYKLRQVDYDGLSEEFDKVVYVKGLFNNENKLDYAYSNQILELNIDNINNSKSCTVDIVNIQGKIIIGNKRFSLEKGINRLQIPIHLEKGVSVLKYNDGVQVLTKKILI